MAHMTPEVIAERLAQGIRENEFPPGSPLRQEDLARLFDVSRNPVREALRILASDGLVTMVQGTGARVRMHSLTELNELYDLRLALELQIAPHVVDGVTGRTLSELHRLVDAMNSSTSVQEWMRNNFVFHTEIYSLAERPHTEGILRGLLAAVQPYSFENIELSGGHSDSDQAHDDMIDALSRRDAAALAEQFESHLERTRSRLNAHYKELEGSADDAIRRERAAQMLPVATRASTEITAHGTA